MSYLHTLNRRGMGRSRLLISCLASFIYIHCVASVSKSAASTDAYFTLNSDQVSCFSTQGNYRNYMEDEVFIAEHQPHDGRQFAFVGAFDGHGGNSVSRYLKRNLFPHLLANLSPSVGRQSAFMTSDDEDVDEHDPNLKPNYDNNKIKKMDQSMLPTLEDYCDALKTSFRIVDDAIQSVSHWSFQGSCAVCCILVNIEDVFPDGYDEVDSISPLSFEREGITLKRAAIIGNIGDSRAVLSRIGFAIPLTEDHKPNRTKERQRIESCGGHVKWCGAVDKKTGVPIDRTGVYRVNGNLAVSRAIGDRSERPFVGSEVDVFSRFLSEEDEFIIVASDGIWDVMTSQEAVSFVRSRVDNFNKALSESNAKNIKNSSSRENNLKSAGLSSKSYVKESEKPNIAYDLCNEAIIRGSTDNITVIILWLQ